MRKALLLAVVVVLLLLPATAGATDLSRISPEVREDGGSVLAARKQRSDEGLFDGIPTGTFVVSLVLCVLIGAAGGKVYAGIMGPRA